MRGGIAGQVDIIVRVLLQEFPGIDATRLRNAVERATAKAATASLDTEGHRIVSQQLARVEQAETHADRAVLLRTLADELETRGDAERALVVRLSAFAELPETGEITPLLRLAEVTERWGELPLDAMTVLVDSPDEANAVRLLGIAQAWKRAGSAYKAADAFERVLLLAPADETAHDGLEEFYRSTGEWPVLIDLLQRRTDHVGVKEQAELYREMAIIYEREMDDVPAARHAYHESDELEPDRPDVLAALGRIAMRLGGLEDEALVVLERQAKAEAGAGVDPKARAQVLHRAAEIARHTDWDKAQSLFEQARGDDPDLIETTDGLAMLLRDRGDLEGCVKVLVDSAARESIAREVRSRWLADAADFCVALGDTDRAKQLYGEARVLDATNHQAGFALVELCWDTGAVVELAPILRELVQTTTEPARLRGYLVQLARVSGELGDRETVHRSLTRAVEIDPHEPAARKELADIEFEAQHWKVARGLIEGLIEEHEMTFGEDERVVQHFRIARCAKELGDVEGAAKETAIALAIDPLFRPALLLRSEVDAGDPFARAADQLALANTAPVEERAVKFAALGDTYMQLGDPSTAREMYREALLYQPTDRMLLTKSLGLVADEGDWSYSVDLVRRLAEGEPDRVVRARYRHLAAMIARDNLDDALQAIELFDRAIDDDGMLFVAADELEATLVGGEDKGALAGFYYRRLGHVRDDEGRAGERLRLWDRLAEVLLGLGRLDDAVVAREVGLSLETDATAARGRREALAALYAKAGAQHDVAAIAHHHTMLAADRRRRGSYVALRALYKRRGLIEQARAVEEALAFVPAMASKGDEVADDVEDAQIDELFAGDLLPERTIEGMKRTLTAEDWAALSREGVDPQLTMLFSLLAPPWAAERVRVKPPRGLAGKEVRDRELPAGVAKVLGAVLAAFGLGRPPVYVDREQIAASSVTLRARDGVLAPVLVIGKAAIDGVVGDRELAFVLAKQLADLRSDRIARLLCPRPTDLAQLVELVLAPKDKGTKTREWLGQVLPPVEVDRVIALGERLREASVDPLRAAREWRAATERAGDRIGLVVAGDLPTAVRMLDGSAIAGGKETNVTADLTRVIDLVWASVGEDVLGVRARLEGWRASPPPPPKSSIPTTP